MKKRRLDSLQHRLFFIIALQLLLSLLLLTALSYQTIRSLKENKLQTSMTGELTRLTQEMTDDYMRLIQLTQQLSPQGIVGALFNQYRQAENPYDSYGLKQTITENIGMITFSNSDIRLLMYYNPADGESYFRRMGVSENFSPEQMPVLAVNGEISYYALARSGNAVQGGNVLSVGRRAHFSGGPMILYVESANTVLESLDALSDSQRMTYTFLQLDKANRVVFSNSDAFAPGSVFTLRGEVRGALKIGETGAFYGVCETTRFGFSNVLLLPKADYNREYYGWIAGTAGLVAFSVLLLLVSLFFIRKLIAKPLAQFEGEIDRLGRGDFSAVRSRGGVREFDDLFLQFNRMKEQIRMLIGNMEQAQQEKHRLEIEKIYYQINPHFLMNTLHSVHWLAKLHNQPEIVAFIAELNYILGYSLGKTEQRTTLRTEIKMLDCYLKLQAMRYEFTADVQVEEGAYLDSPTARLILQPLAENAIHHGLGEPGKLLIRIFLDEKRRLAVFTIEDNGRGLTREELLTLDKPFAADGDEKNNKNNGIGLRYVRSMLEAHYGPRAILSIRSEAGRGTKVTLLLPTDKEGTKHASPE